jgi:hypothetical protein
MYMVVLNHLLSGLQSSLVREQRPIVNCYSQIDSPVKYSEAPWKCHLIQCIVFPHRLSEVMPMMYWIVAEERRSFNGGNP